MAQMPFSPCDDASACTDASVDMLRRIFGGVVDALVTGADPDTVAASSNILATMFSFFNSGILIIGSLIVSYVAVMGTLNTANDGEAMGRNWSSLWTPVRIVAGGAVLLPTTSGFSFIQLVVMMFALWGVGFANGTYKTGMAMGILSPDGVVQGVNQPGTYYGMRDFARQYLAASYCARAANSIYADGGVSPQVQANPTQDKIKTTDGRTEYTFYIKDRSATTNLAGGEPFCGTVNVARYTAQAMSDPTAAALEQLRAAVQDKKVAAAADMMQELEAWVNTWPSDINQPGWENVDSDKFNTIVKKYEDKVATDLASSVTGNQAGVDSGLTSFANSLTSDGWSAAGGWFQRVGMVRGQIANVMSESVGSVTSPSLSALPADARSTLLSNSVTTVTEAINKKSEEKASYASSNTAKPEDIASLIPKDAQSDINPGSIKANMDAKMSSFVNRTMQDVVEIATGANGPGTTPLCGTAGQMGGSLNRMKCVGDYLAVARAGIAVADVAIKTAATALRVVAGTLSSVKGVGTGLDLDKVVTPIWDWVIEVPVKQLAMMASYIEPLAFYFGVFLPSLPYTIFMIVVVGWILAVLQSIIAAPLWAVMHMTPDRTFVGSQTQGYLLLLSLFARPALAVVGLFAAVLVSDPIIDYIAKGFFAMRGAVVSSTGTVGAIAEFLTFAWWFMVFGLTLLPVLYMTFGLPQILPDHVLRWIGAGVSDLGETSAVGQMRGGMAAAGAGVGAAAGRLGNTPKARLGRGGGLLPDDTPPGGGSPGGGGGRSGGGGRLAQTLNTNPQGVAPQAPEMQAPPPSPPADNRRMRDKVGEAAGVAIGRGITGGTAAAVRTVGRAGTVALSAGVAGVSAYQDSDGASFGERLGNARLAATGAGIIAGTAAAKMTGRDFAKAGETAISEGKAAYSEGADARIAAFKSELRGEAPISAGSPGGSGAVDSSYDSRYAPPPPDTNAAGVAAGAVGAATVAASPSAGADAGRSATLSTGGNAPLGEVAGDDGYGQGESAASAAAMAAGVSRAGAADSPSVIAAMPSYGPSDDPMAHPRDRFGGDPGDAYSAAVLQQDTSRPSDPEPPPSLGE